MNTLKLIQTDLLDVYSKDFDKTLKSRFEELKDSELSLDTFSFYTSVAAVFSSKIEGENIELDSYLKYKKLGVEYKADYTKKSDDLYDAYLYAQIHPLNEENLLKAHAVLSQNLLSVSKRGKYRTGNMFVMTSEGKIEYVAPSPYKLKFELSDFYEDLKFLLNEKLSFEEVFFFASFLHLVFVKIHPFEDGNGRTARLLEKWFLAEKLGEKAWFLSSEKFYYDNHQLYYDNLRCLGLEYEELDYSKALPFLEMLAKSLDSKD